MMRRVWHFVPAKIARIIGPLKRIGLDRGAVWGTWRGDGACFSTGTSPRRMVQNQRADGDAVQKSHNVVESIVGYTMYCGFLTKSLKTRMD